MAKAMEPEIELVLRAVPEFAARYLELVEAADDDPGPAIGFEELAAFVAELAEAVERCRPILERAMAAVEAVAADPGAEDVVGWSFLDTLSPDERRRLVPWMGPRTAAALERIELPAEAHQ